MFGLNIVLIKGNKRRLRVGFDLHLINYYYYY